MDYRWRVLGCAWLVGFFMYATVASIPPLLNLIKNDFGLTYAETGIVYTVPILALIVISLPSGILADRIGPKRTVGIGILLLGVGGLLRGTATELPPLLLFFVIVGLGWGLVISSAAKFVGSWFSAGASLGALSIYFTGQVLGSAVALATTLSVITPIVGGWHGALIFWGFLTIAATCIWWVIVRDPPRTINLSTEGVASHTITVLKARGVWALAGLWFVCVALFYVQYSFLPFFFISRGVNATTANLLVSIILFSGVPSVLLMPILSFRFTRRKPFLLASGLIYLIASVLLTQAYGSWFYLVSMALGASLLVFQMFLLFLPIELVEQRYVGTVAGLTLLVGFAGGVFGPTLIGFIVDLSASFSVVPAYLTVSAIAWSLISLILPETRGRRATPD